MSHDTRGIKMGDVLLIMSFFICAIAALVFSCLDMRETDKQIKNGKRNK